LSVVSLGVDYGTGSWKTALLGEAPSAVLWNLASPEEVRAIIAEVDGRHPGLPIVLPSGFGVPLRRVQDLDDRDLFEIALRREAPSERGLSRFLASLKDSPLNAYCIPAVKLLPSVPIHRKVNRVDMGTSDKVCSAAFFLSRLHERGTRLEEIDFLALETGEAFRAVVAVQGGRIVDGLGGTAGGIGPRCRGRIDGELAYLYDWASKEAIYRGGARDIDERYGGFGDEAFWEELEKDVLTFLHFYGLKAVVVGGRRQHEVMDRLGPRFPLETVAGDSEGFEAAIGAALLADGIAGGRHSTLVRHLGLREARDRALDWIYR
jgi:predicted butyrate kinase (DUF1464 family)